ncbi:methyl-accepting chemotaxis protein [Vibrio sp. Y2-5]|uniref:methyl-accepting chemotaxis protein n=1 Tax=Vibrio sp. Y2-5 TaxID=2743977 RepID=UPI0016610E9F|nr:methyl-accepting chemotaxis protein [Vibrio sp. Y2-5]MBD0788162.1 methyl-accepting chemotaxis protein [Vibrio sp. Y2-5]
MKFKNKIIGASAILFVVAIGGMSLFQVSSIKTEMESVVGRSLNEISVSVARMVDADMESRIVLAQATSENIELDPTDKSYVRSLLDKPQLKKIFMAAGFGFENDGSMVENDDSWEPDSSYDPRKRPWYIDAKKADKTIITAPYVDVASGKVIISIASPIHSASGSFIGAMYFDMSLDHLTKLVNSVNLMDSGELSIVAANGTTIAHKNDELNGKDFSTYLPQATLKEGFEDIDIEGKPYIAGYTYIPSKDWYVVGLINEDSAFAVVKHMIQHSVIGTILSVLIVIVVLSFMIKVLMRPLKSLDEAIENVASGDGDLTQRLSTKTDPEFAVLAEGFNSFMAKLQHQIKESVRLGNEIKSGSLITSNDLDLANSSLTEQLQEIEQLATAMHEMATTANDVARTAQGASESAKEAERASEEGAEIVTDTTRAINELAQHLEDAVLEVIALESSSKQIESILKVINEIAEQTNLLALNAAIEAARAGEAGRGFAVVADEVRSLASRTQKSTTEIRSMIEQLQSGTNNVVSMMNRSRDNAFLAVDKSNQANGALNTIMEAIQRIHDQSIQIASAAEEQSLVAEEINNNTVKIKDLSDKVSETAVEAKTSMDNTNVHVQDQYAILSHFKI